MVKANIGLDAATIDILSADLVLGVGSDILEVIKRAGRLGLKRIRFYTSRRDLDRVLTIS
ncbi:hypothetical protein AG1IA_02953 [Rhizoctonia solani AG-1 IA]|uniref:Uncharacterized protein n=1 Tax=Thanatephorus cucumeris (strain AG1-IA) TaxID=983506 RepID=L8X313_THACA|nr:hypothetical protein AG1IA_02953 [Rhizoctonia solani AG-1 IA]